MQKYQLQKYININDRSADKLQEFRNASEEELPKGQRDTLRSNKYLMVQGIQKVPKGPWYPNGT